MAGELSDINPCIFENRLTPFAYCSIRHSFMGFDVADEWLGSGTSELFCLDEILIKVCDDTEVDIGRKGRQFNGIDVSTWFSCLKFSANRKDILAG